MAEYKNKKNKRRTGWWILVGVVLVAAVLVGWQVWRARQQASQALANVETEPYQRGSLSASIYGTGSVKPYQTAVLTWSASGIVGEIHVFQGQFVEKDALLLSLDMDSISVDILQAQIDVINRQNALDDLYDNWGAELSQVKLDLLNAEEALDDLETERLIMNYKRCSDERIEELEEDLENAQDLYDFRQTEANLRAVNTAQANLNYCRADYTEREIAEAELKIELGEAQVKKLKKRVDLLADGPDPDQVTILETQLAMAESRLESPLVKAPFNGVITVLDVQVGDVVQVGTKAVQMDDLTQLYLDVQISEIDISLVDVGQRALLVFDAYFENTFEGEVVQISPVGTTVQGVVEYTVRINMLGQDDERIKPGMTAGVTIVVEEKEDIFLIPNDAIVNINGQESVYVRRNEAYEAVPVTLGSNSDFYSEVIEADIREGELIILNPSAEITGDMPFGGRPGGGFGGFGN